jgi:hypothetical protein
MYGQKFTIPVYVGNFMIYKSVIPTVISLAEGKFNLTKNRKVK